MKGLTRSQERVLEFFARHVEEHGSPPTYREIAAAVGSRYTNAGATYVDKLVAKGMVSKTDKVSRGTKLTAKGREYLRLLAQRSAA